MYRALPSSFLSKASKRLHSSKDFFFDRDIVCLPKSLSTASGVIKFPRGSKAREDLASRGLIGKIRLASSMTQDDIFL